MRIEDDFSTDCATGKVIGTASTSGHIRQGTDVEKTISIDNNALRIQPLITPGWNRTSLSYGPFKREAGLALGVWMLNGHNTSEGNDIGETLKGRFFRWLRGSGSEFIGSRLLHWATSRHQSGTLRQFYRWVRNRKGRFGTEHLKENLAVGWFEKASPADASRSGQSIVVRADGPEISALCTRTNHKLTPAFKGLQNLQVYYLVILREQGAAYYAASVPNAYGLSAYPYMRLIGIDASSPQHEQKENAQIYAGIHQSALGQVGFRADTRVYGLRAEVLPSLSNWHGTAQCADTLLGKGGLGDGWSVLKGRFERTEQGLISKEVANIALFKTPEPSGAIHLRIDTAELLGTESAAGEFTTNNAPPRRGIACNAPTGSQCEPGLLLGRVCLKVLWRSQDHNNTWALSIEPDQCALLIREDGQWSTVATDKRFSLLSQPHHAVLILDQGDFFSLYLNGNLLFEQWFSDTRLQEQTQIGLMTSHASNLSLHHLESHAHNIPIPQALKMGDPWQVQDSQTVVSDSFAGDKGELEGRHSEIGEQAWHKELGSGQILLTGENAARVSASTTEPNPNRLAYTLGWPHPEFAEVSVTILPPGTQRHQQEKGRGGLIFWQDSDNYLIVSHWLDDSFHSASMCAFFRIDGFEEVYDAVWSNVGDRIQWGQTHQLKVTFNGLRFTAHIDNEPVLYRSLTDIYPRLNRLLIHRVGIVANWDWGDDTGSSFSKFIAKK